MAFAGWLKPTTAHHLRGRAGMAGKSVVVSEKVARMRAVVNGQPMSAWDELWGAGVMPWDLEQVTPVVARMVQQQQQQELELEGTLPLLPQGRALVPGCGSGYDAVALASPKRSVVGLDISEKAVARARARAVSCGDPNARFVEFVAHDFFTYAPAAAFDLVWDYTFFCALEPDMRGAWAKKVAELLAPTPAAVLVTLMYPVADYVGGPPYAVSVEAYEEVLHAVGFEAALCRRLDDDESVEARRGREVLAVWRRTNCGTKL